MANVVSPYFPSHCNHWCNANNTLTSAAWLSPRPNSPSWHFNFNPGGNRRPASLFSYEPIPNNLIFRLTFWTQERTYRQQLRSVCSAQRRSRINCRYCSCCLSLSLSLTSLSHRDRRARRVFGARCGRVEMSYVIQT